MSFASRRSYLCSGVAVVALACGGGAWAQERAFNVPSEESVQAIPEFARQAGIQIIAPAGKLKGVRLPAIKGTRELHEALSLLVANTGLKVASDNGQTIVLSAAQDSHAQASEPTHSSVADEGNTIETITITGYRQSLRSALNIKKNNTEIVDAIVAEDIGKLPDNNLAEALQRIPGIQITRNHGEGSGVAIRGLTQVKTLMNGREVFSDTGRDLSLENVPAEILGGIDVYKNPSAGLIEGGLGGVVNLKTPGPFDFQGFTASGNVRFNYYDLVDKAKPQVSGLISNRWNTQYGEIGALLSVAYIRSAGRLDQVGFEPYNDRYNIVDFNKNGNFPGTNADPGDRVISPNGGGVSIEYTDRVRTSVNSKIEWRPTATLAFYVEGSYAKYNYKQNNDSIYANRGSLLPAPGTTFTFYDGSNVVRTGAYRDVVITSNTNYADRNSYTSQVAGGGNWQATDNLKVEADVAYTKSRTDAYNGSLRIGNVNHAVGNTLTFDTSTAKPTLKLSGSNLSDPANYDYINSSHALEDLDGSSTAARADITYNLASFIDSISFGARYAGRSVDRQQGTQNHIPTNVASRPGSLLPEGLTASGVNDFLLDTPTTNLADLLAPSFALARNIGKQCAVFGDTVCQPVFSPLNTYHQDEETYALYGQANFKFEVAGFPVDGNVGGRWVKTDLSVSGYRTANIGGGVPINQSNDYNSFLPSLNARAELMDKLFLRVAAAKQLTRPSFANLAPSLTLGIQTAVGLTGNAGNPDLAPLKSTSYDVSVEYYFSDNGYAYVSGFRKNVVGFIQTITSTEAVNLPDYPGYTSAQITRPQNGGNGTINGAEIGVQTVFDFLPAPFDGFGVQANYTYVDSSAPGPIAGQTVPLVGLSKNNINTVLFYEKGRLLARLAYNWRDDYVDTTSGPGSGALPVYAKPFGILDASIGYSLYDNVDLTLDGSNLTHTKYASYFGEMSRVRFNNVFDRRVGISVRVKY